MDPGKQASTKRGESYESCVCFLLESQLFCRLFRASNSELGGCSVPNYLIQASYQAAGAKGLMSEGGSKRRDVASKAISAAGGKVDAFYFAFGEHDAYVVVDLPDNVSAATASLAINASGVVRTTTTVLLTSEEVDAATKKSVPYRAPGQ
jgi:uncharacterized protein with GYD domain